MNESLGNGGTILEFRKTVRASPGRSLGLVTDKMINIGEGFLELSTRKLSDEGSREIENEDLGKSFM